jgi:hypothetical protein
MAQDDTALTYAKCDLDEQPCAQTVGGQLTFSGCPQVNISASGGGTFALSPGRGCVGGFLTSGAAVTSVVTDLTFDSTRFGLVSCAVNSGIGKVLSRTTLGPGVERITINDAPDDMNINTISSGQLFACELTVASGLPTGTNVIDNVSTASNASGAAFPTTSIDGAVNITNCAADCNGSGRVLIPEVNFASSIFLGQPLCNPSSFTLSCPNADVLSINGRVAINEVQNASCLFLSAICAKTCAFP